LDFDLVVNAETEFFQERSFSTISLPIFFSATSIFKTLWRKTLSSLFTSISAAHKTSHWA
jgi:hypothetical protein